MRAGQMVGAERAGEELEGGRVAASGRWWPARWWSGHHFTRHQCGVWQPTRRRLCPVDNRRADYDAYLLARYDAAERACRAHMRSPAGIPAGANAWELVNGRRPALTHASEELRAWLEAHPLVRRRDLAPPLELEAAS